MIERKTYTEADLIRLVEKAALVDEAEAMLPEDADAATFSKCMLQAVAKLKAAEARVAELEARLAAHEGANAGRNQAIETMRAKVSTLERERDEARGLARGRGAALRKAWDMYENAGLGSEVTGRTGNKLLDDLGSLLDSQAMMCSGEAPNA